MNLLERSNSLLRDIGTLEGLRKRAEQANDFERRANDLTAPAHEFQKLDFTIDVAARHSIAVPALDRGLIGSLHQRIADIQVRYAEDKTIVLDPFPNENVKYVLIQPLQQLPTKASSALLNAWQAWARQLLPSIDTEVLDILGGIASLKGSVDTVRALRREADMACGCLPTSDDDINHVKQLADSIRTAWHNLAGEGVPTDVLAFLRAAGSRDGASFNILTTTILDWLTTHGLQDSLRVRMG